jgi:hypothetical protein
MLQSQIRRGWIVVDCSPSEVQTKDFLWSSYLWFALCIVYGGVPRKGYTGFRTDGWKADISDSFFIWCKKLHGLEGLLSVLPWWSTTAWIDTANPNFSILILILVYYILYLAALGIIQYPSSSSSSAIRSQLKSGSHSFPGCSLTHNQLFLQSFIGKVLLWKLWARVLGQCA